MKTYFKHSYVRIKRNSLKIRINLYLSGMYNDIDSIYKDLNLQGDADLNKINRVKDLLNLGRTIVANRHPNINKMAKDLAERFTNDYLTTPIHF